MFFRLGISECVIILLLLLIVCLLYTSDAADECVNV